MTDNVISFNKESGPPTSEDEVHNRVIEMRAYHIEATIAEVIKVSAPLIEVSGFYIPEYEDEENEANQTSIKLFSLYVEALRSFLCNEYNIHHNLHDVVNVLVDKNLDECYTVPDNIVELMANTVPATV